MASINTPKLEMTRQQLYDEVWKTSVMGLSKEYGIPYSLLLKQIKAADIPIPPSGYWTKISFGKPVEKIPLEEPFDQIIKLYSKLPGGSENSVEEEELKDSKENIIDKTQKEPETRRVKEPQLLKKLKGPQPAEPAKMSAIAQEEPETIKRWGQTMNVYDRETLYKEVWEYPVLEVAKKYKVSDVAIHKVCKSLDIPTPGRGYWTKLKAGKPVNKTPLPKGNTPDKKQGMQTGTVPLIQTDRDMSFLREEEKEIIFAVASQIVLPNEKDKMHSMIVEHRKKVEEWHRKKKMEPERGYTLRGRKEPDPPYLTQNIAEKTLPRVCHIIDTLIKAMEPLEVKLTKDLAFVVTDETVRLSFSESQDKVSHVLSKDESLQMLKYEEERKKYPWTSKPQIRKYDYVYNGRLSIMINGRTFRDCKSYKVEDRLGDVMLEMYIDANEIKKARLAREEAERRREEAARRAEEARKRYNKEVDRTLALVNEAADYATACQIRAYIAAVEEHIEDEKVAEWIDWARKKADWFDPTISAKDEYFGVRSHEKDDDRKKLKHEGYWW